MKKQFPIALLALFGIALPAFTHSQSEFNADQISVRLAIPQSSVCLGASGLNVDAILTNNSGKYVEISADGLYSNLRLTKYRDNRVVSGGGHLAEITPVSWVRLAPHQSTIVTFTQSLGSGQSQDKQFFQTAGFFSIQIGFEVFLKTKPPSYSFKGTSKSNEAFFLLSECK